MTPRPQNSPAIARIVGRHDAAMLALVGILTVVAFYPATRYFFAQDDFSLIQAASFEPARSVERAFSSVPGQFRPLTKVGYFVFAHRLFGLHAQPYHWASLLIHLLNVWLLYRVLRSLRFGAPGAWIACSLFAMATSVFNTVAWIAAIQPLLGGFFALAALAVALGGSETAQRTSGRRTGSGDAKCPSERISASRVAASTVLYALALVSMEQTVAVPVLVLGGIWATRPGVKWAPLARRFWPMVMVGLAYVAFMLLWKGIPNSGPYAGQVGGNVATNLLTYADWALAFSTRFPLTFSPAGPTTSHLVLLALVLNGAARRRGRIAAVAAAYFACAIAPVLPFEGHLFYTHIYIPYAGIFVLMAPAIDDAVGQVAAWRGRVAGAAPAALVALVCVVSTWSVRSVEHDWIRPDYRLPKDYVLRRAVVAERAVGDLKSKLGDWRPRGGRFYLIFTADAQSWYASNVSAALGGGDAFRLFLDDPLLEVSFLGRGATISEFDRQQSRIVFYDAFGRLYTTEEAAEKFGAGIVEESAAP